MDTECEAADRGGFWNTFSVPVLLILKCKKERNVGIAAFPSICHRATRKAIAAWNAVPGEVLDCHFQFQLLRKRAMRLEAAAHPLHIKTNR